MSPSRPQKPRGNDRYRRHQYRHGGQQPRYHVPRITADYIYKDERFMNFKRTLESASNKSSKRNLPPVPPFAQYIRVLQLYGSENGWFMRSRPGAAARDAWEKLCKRKPREVKRLRQQARRLRLDPRKGTTDRFVYVDDAPEEGVWRVPDELDQGATRNQPLLMGAKGATRGTEGRDLVPGFGSEDDEKDDGIEGRWDSERTHDDEGKGEERDDESESRRDLSETPSLNSLPEMLASGPPSGPPVERRPDELNLVERSLVELASHSGRQNMILAQLNKRNELLEDMIKGMREEGEVSKLRERVEEIERRLRDFEEYQEMTVESVFQRLGDLEEGRGVRR